jgi:2-oxo-4-hydroxy-4-carboxy-5-ureidoimidazoline decarboxylase
VNDASSVVNAASDPEAVLLRCCGSARWASEVAAQRPFADDEALFGAADAVWSRASREDILEALTHHPRIGADLDELRKKYASTASWAAGEQSGAQSADEATLIALRDGNVAYEARYGHIFVVCATGKRAEEMLAILQARMNNTPEDELQIAAAEQGKITRIRLEKLA